MAQAAAGGAHLFKNPSLFSILTQDARTAGVMGDPALLKAIVALQQRPELYDQYLRHDARLAVVLEVLVDRSDKPPGPGPASAIPPPPPRSTEPLWQLLRHAAEEEARAAVASLGRNAPFLREVGPRGLTALMEAAARRRKGERLVAALIQQGAPVHALGAQGRTALHWAAASGNAAAARALLEAGADVGARDEGDATALELALAGAHDDTAATLIDAMERASRVAPPQARIAQSNDSSPSPARAAPATAAAPAPAASPTPPPQRASTPTPTPTPTATTTATAGPKGGDEDLITQLLALEGRVAELEAAVAAKEKRINTLEEEAMCSVCMERPVDTVILECAHTVLCTKCGAQPHKTCPVCNKLITRIIRTFRA